MISLASVDPTIYSHVESSAPKARSRMSTRAETTTTTMTASRAPPTPTLAGPQCSSTQMIEDAITGVELQTLMAEGITAMEPLATGYTIDTGSITG